MHGLPKPVLRIAAEGWGLMAVLAALCVLAALGEAWLWLAVGISLILVTATYFHDMPRSTTAKPTGILAPCDGRVTFRRECHDPYLGREAIRIRIALPFFANYLLRAPVEGEVTSIPGAPKTLSCICTDEGEAVIVALTLGNLLGVRPVWPAYGERIGQGRICGKRRLARAFDVYLPSDCRVEVQMGDTIRAGETILATLLRRNA